MNKDKLISDLKRDEGYVPHAYEDSLGYWTIGYGTLIDKRGGGIPEDVATILLQRHVGENTAKVNKQLPWLSTHPEQVQPAIHNMACQLGVSGLLSFKTTFYRIKK